MSSSAPKTVLCLTPSVRLLGARRSLLTLVTNLDRSRWRPVVCGQSEGDLSDELQLQGIPYRIVKTGWWRKAKYFLWRPFAIAQLSALIRELNASVVHCNEIYPNPYAVRAAGSASDKLHRRVPVVTHMRLTVTERMIRNYDLHRADKILVPSEASGHDFDLWPDKGKRVEVIPNGVDLREFRRSRTRAEARRQIGVPPEGPLLAAIGQLGPRKGGDLILKAVRRAAAEIAELKVMFVGNPHRGQEEFAEELRREAGEPDLRERVFFFPYTQQILPYYEAADVNLLISREEGFGRTIIEAGSLGVPSIGTRIGGIPELIVDGKTGFLVEPENEDQLAQVIGRVAKDEALLGSMQDDVYRHVAQSFSIHSHVTRIMDIYDSLAGSELAP